MVRFFLERHLLVHVITVVVLALGLFIMSNSQREGFPGVTLNQVVITAVMPGASPEDVEAKLVGPIEEAVAEVDGVESYFSVARESMGVITVDLHGDFGAAQVKEAEDDLQKALDAITDLPSDLETPPVISRFDPAKMPVLEIAVTGPWSGLRAVAEEVEARMRRLPGVSRVEIIGIGERELHVLVDPRRAHRKGVTLDEVMAAIARRNVASTGGKLTVHPEQRQVVVSGEYRSAAEIADTLLRFDAAGGGGLRVSDVAEVVEAEEETGLRAHADGQRMISVLVSKRASADILDVVDAIRADIEGQPFPEGYSYSLYNDQSRLARNRLSVVYSNGLGGVVLVLLVLLVFLSVRVAFWVAFGLPFCILGVLALLPGVGVTINMVSMAGFVLVIGIVVDDAIVVAERIAYWQEKGESAIEAAVRGTKEMAIPVVGSSLTTVLAFSPMFMIGGIPGKFAWAIPTIVILTLIVSLFECFFILPSHMAGNGKVRSRPKAAWLQRMEAGYARLLTRLLPHGGKIGVAFFALFVFSSHHAVTSMPVQLFPQDDADALYVKVRAPLGRPVEFSEAAARAIEAQLPALIGEDLEGVTARIGHQEPEKLALNRGSSEHEGLVTAYLENERRWSAHAWISRLREDLVVPEGVEVVLEAKRIGPPLGKPVTVHIASQDDRARVSAANEVLAYLSGIEAVEGLESDERPGITQVDLRLDYERLALKRVPVETVTRTVQAAFFGLPISEIGAGPRERKVRVRFDRGARSELESLLSMPVAGIDGQLHSLRDVVNPVEVPALAEIHHREGIRTLTVSSQLAAGSGETATSMAKRLQAELLPRFEGRGGDLRVYIGGEATKSAETIGDMPAVLGMAVAGIVMVVWLLTGSVLQALFVISAIPLGFVGVVWAYEAHQIPISMFALLGVTGLAGVVVNDSIVMVTSLNKTALAARDVPELIAEVSSGAAERLRPVLLTTLTTVAGVMPTAYGLGGRDALLSPMSVALGYGLIFGTTITLFLVPSLYVVRRRIEMRVARWFGRAPTPQAGDHDEAQFVSNTKG